MSDFYKSRHGAYFGTRMVEVVSSSADEVKFREARRFGRSWFVADNAPISRMTRAEFENSFTPTGGDNSYET